MTTKKKTHLPCPLEGCGSSDAFTMYEDGRGYCFSCKGTLVDKSTYSKTYKDFEEVASGDYRGIPEHVCRKLGITTFADDDGNIVYRVYAYGDKKKIRRVGDKDFRVEGGSLPGLWGADKFNAASAKTITVVEGEEDAAAFYTMFNKGDNVQYPVVSLTSASIPQSKYKEIHDYLNTFQQVKLAIDNDGRGAEAKRVLALMLPNKCLDVQLTKWKDANDYLIHGDVAEFKRSWDNAKPYTPDNIFHTERDLQSIVDDEFTESVVPTGFTGLDSVINGIPLNHITLVTGMEGMGKSEIIRAIEYQMLSEDVPIAICHPEDTKSTMLRGLACYQMEENVRKSDDKEAIKKAIEEMTNGHKNLYLFEFKDDPSVQEVVGQFNYLVHVLGVRYIFVDPLNHFQPSDANESKVRFLDTLAKRLEKFCASNPVGLVWSAHVNDDGQTRDSRMISKACSIRIDVQREHMHDDPGVRNTVHLHVSKNRPFSVTGYAGNAFFDADTFRVVDSGGVPVPVTEGDKKDVIPF